MAGAADQGIVISAVQDATAGGTATSVAARKGVPEEGHGGGRTG